MRRREFIAAIGSAAASSAIWPEVGARKRPSAATLAGLQTLIQIGHRPDRYVPSTRFGSMPSAAKPAGVRQEYKAPFSTCVPPVPKSMVYPSGLA